MANNEEFYEKNKLTTANSSIRIKNIYHIMLGLGIIIDLF